MEIEVTKTPIRIRETETEMGQTIEFNDAYYLVGTYYHSPADSGPVQSTKVFTCLDSAEVWESLDGGNALVLVVDAVVKVRTPV